MTQVNRACPVCLHVGATSVFDNTMAAVGSHDMSYKIGRCTRCGFHFANELPDKQTFFSYYKSVSKYDIAGQISRIDQSRIDAAVEICRDRIPFDAMIVDLGCGYGALLSCLKTAGWNNLHGVDPAPNSDERARTLFGFEGVHCGTMSEAHKVLPLERADLICIMAVLEHLPDLRADLSALLKKLRPGCRILVEVPALECFSGSDSEPFGEFSLEHIQFFASTSLVNLFQSLGSNPLILETQNLPSIASGSLFGLFELANDAVDCPEPVLETCDHMNKYIADSSQKLAQALARVPQAPLIVYGAGSHSARLLPQLARLAGTSIAAVVDNNPNLLGKEIGDWVIQPPSVIDSLPQAHILISSFRSQDEIASSLSGRFPNPLVLLYE